jgi:hypothetical protein
MSTGGILMPPTAPITLPPAFFHQRRENADQAAGLVRRVGQALDVLEEGLARLVANGEASTG